MAQNLTLEIAPREHKGKGSVRRRRNRENIVPAVVYGAGEESISVELTGRVLSHAEQSENFMAQIIELQMNGQSQQVVVRDVQRHPISDKIMHVDFLRIREDQELQVSIPVRFINEDQCVGVRMGGGTITHNLIEVEISCLPKDLPEALIVDMTDVDIGNAIHLSGLSLPPGVSIPALAQGVSQDRDLPVVSVSLQRVEVEEAELVDEDEFGIAAEDVEGEEASADEADAEGPSEE